MIAEERRVKRNVKEKMKESGWKRIKHIRKWRYDFHKVPQELASTVLAISAASSRVSILSIFKLYFSDTFLNTLMESRREEISSNWAVDSGIKLTLMHIKQVGNSLFSTYFFISQFYFFIDDIIYHLHYGIQVFSSK